MHAKLDRDKFFVNQKHMAFGKSKYYVYDEAGAPLYYVERPVRLGLNRRADITLFEDETGGQAALVLQQENAIEWRHRNYTLVDGQDGSVVARLTRDNLKSLFRRRWLIIDPQGNIIGTAREDSATKAFFRRIIDWIPYVGILGFALMRTNFDIVTFYPAGEYRVGTFVRKFSIGDKYVLDLTDDAEKRLDRRIALSLGILLDTAEAR